MRRRRTNPLILLATVLALAIGAWWSNEDAPRDVPEAVQNDAERAELARTLALIERGGPFPHEQDGAVFANREQRLPRQPRGYYHEYTVRTPGASNRGARRVVRGDGGELYYTRDHYRTFTRIN